MSSLSIILGCMYSGKSSELLRRVSRYTSIGIRVCLINSSSDTRTDNSVKTHSGKRVVAIKIDKLMKLITSGEFLHSPVIAIDEAHFFPDLLEFVKEIEKHNKIIIVSGLDGDYRREPIGDILKLIPLCDDVVKLKALDMVDKDGSSAIFSKRIVESDEQILVGAQEAYIAVSRKNYLSM
tara:strand:- start:91 stop:630 length:540 start_codon:yes stop_codon:yes gene_type:complete